MGGLDYWLGSMSFFILGLGTIQAHIEPALDESILVLFVLGLNLILLAQKGHNILCFTLKQRRN